jgi:hypothetical protein
MNTVIDNETRDTIWDLFAKDELDIVCKTGGTYAGVIMKNKSTGATLAVFEEGNRLQLFGSLSFLNISHVKEKVRKTLFIAELSKKVECLFNDCLRPAYQMED